MVLLSAVGGKGGGGALTVIVTVTILLSSPPAGPFLVVALSSDSQGQRMQSWSISYTISDRSG